MGLVIVLIVPGLNVVPHAVMELGEVELVVRVDVALRHRLRQQKVVYPLLSAILRMQEPAL